MYFNRRTRLFHFLRFFSEESKLGNIENGTVGEENVNVDSVKDIAEDILKEMEGKLLLHLLSKE